MTNSKVALNKQTFGIRTTTAVVFAAVMLIGLFWNKWAFMFLFTVIMIGCLVEYGRLVNKFNRGLVFLAIFYIIIPLLMMMDLGVDRTVFETGNKRLSGNFTPLFPCAIIFSVWINDTMAYIVGSLIGKTPFSKISPNKTWEGTGGGAVLCIVVIAILGSVVPAAKHIALQHWIAIAAICAIFGTLGDLLQSKLKRLANVKDSGDFMPGHGGFLDRFDSMIVATPFVWCYTALFL
jgi:phosphatidate cytidylyltransferase